MTAGQGFNKWFIKKSKQSKQMQNSGSGKSCEGSRDRKNVKKEVFSWKMEIQVELSLES